MCPQAKLASSAIDKSATATSPWQDAVEKAKQNQTIAGRPAKGECMNLYSNPAMIDSGLDSRSISFENPTGTRGAGGMAHGGRKGAPNRRIEPGEKLVLADIEGPGQVRHIWMTFRPMRPEHMRAVWIEVYYDDLDQPSISVPCVDFFGLPHGRPVHYVSALTAVQQGRGYNAYFPMPFRDRMRFEFTNGSDQTLHLYYQIDYTLERRLPPGIGYLHATFRRENPTVLRQDFVIAEGFEGPGRFLGCAVGIRVFDDDMDWYGEGEFKVYRDGDRDYPTICGTGLEDYVGTAWGLEDHTAFYQGAPLWVVEDPSAVRPKPDLVGFYRWHLPDPILFQKEIRVTIQQIGAMGVPLGQEHLLEKYQPAGEGWMTPDKFPEFANFPMAAFGIAERTDDYCATAFVYCEKPQAVPRLDVAAAVADVHRAAYEKPTRMELMLEAMLTGELPDELSTD
jgi:hypothetical protein